MNNSRMRKNERRRVALNNRKKQLQYWKEQPVTEELTVERKKQKILKAEQDIAVLKNRIN